MTTENIFPIFDELVSREEKGRLIKQKACCFWFTGLSGSGKSTLGKAVERKLYEMGYLTQVLDGDNVRTGINNNLGFSEDDRKENIRRIAEVSKLFVNCGIITINCFVSPTRAIRQLAQDIIGPDDFKEVFINAPLSVCENRDVKGLYKKARKGLIKDFTGIDAPFEAPENPVFEVQTDQTDFASSVDRLMQFILPIIRQN